MNRQQWTQLIIVLIFFGFSALKVIFGKLQQQAARRKIELEQERQRLEALRTGRPLEEVASPERPRRVGPTPEQLQELARRRAAQLEELRRVQAAQGRQNPQRTQAGGVIASIPGSSGPTVPGTRPPTRPGRAERGERRPQRTPRGERPAREDRTPRPVQTPPSPIQAVPIPWVPAPPPAPPAKELYQLVPTIKSRAAAGKAFLGRMSGAELRSAIIAAEILGRPACDRI